MALIGGLLVIGVGELPQDIKLPAKRATSANWVNRIKVWRRQGLKERVLRETGLSDQRWQVVGHFHL